MGFSATVGAVASHYRMKSKMDEVNSKMETVETTLAGANKAIEHLAINTEKAVSDAHSRIKGVEERAQKRHEEMRDDVKYIRDRLDKVIDGK